MKKIIKLTENDIQKLVVKIIKEDVDDEFSWVNDLDVSRGEKQFKKSWRRISKEWSVDMDNTFELQEPVYRYYSKISFYDFKRPENRWTRDKGLLFSIINNLKRSGFWEKISNKDFLIVNSYNKKANVKERMKVLKEIQKNFPK
jgi:hypothetical protein